MKAAELAFLSRLFSYPESPPSREDLARLKTTWGDEHDPEALRALQAEYVRLFINALPEVPCPPYGSFYLEGTLMGESTVRLQKLYARHGWQTDEPADHLAVELEFLALLAALPQDEARRQDYHFLLDHLKLWLPDFLARVEENDRSGFYRGAAGYAKRVMSAVT